MSLDFPRIPEFSRKKLKVKCPTQWEHHRGGWKYAVKLIAQHLHDDEGTLCISSVEDYVLDEETISEAWVGFIHQVPRTKLKWFPDLERLLDNDHFRDNMLSTCKGLFVLSSVVKDYLLANWPVEVPKVPIVKVWYPATPGWKAFDWTKFSQSNPKKVLFIGEYLRNFDAFNRLQLPGGYKKILLKAPDVDFTKLGVTFNSEVTLIERVSDEEYDTLLEESIVFLNLFDAPANTTVIECLTRNCPIVVNRLPGLEEYLQPQYPLFYNTLDQAAEMITSNDILIKARTFMQHDHPTKKLLSRSAFLYQLQNCSIYRSLPIPPSQHALPLQKTFTVTIVICSYNRVHNMQRLFQKLIEQELETSQTFEVILWNNNFDKRQELRKITKPFRDHLNMKIIDSTENFYCIIRLAVVHLMRSDIMLICDDDVIPQKSFVQRFLHKYEQYGRDSVLCCRGHTFQNHQLNEENPEECWQDYEHLQFHTEKQEDQQVCKSINLNLVNPFNV